MHWLGEKQIKKITVVCQKRQTVATQGSLGEKQGGKELKRDRRYREKRVRFYCDGTDLEEGGLGGSSQEILSLLYRKRTALIGKLSIVDSL